MPIEFARNYKVLGDTGKQRARAVEAQRLLSGLADEQPGDWSYQFSYAAALSEVDDVLVAQGNLSEALQSYRDCLATEGRPTPTTPAGSATSAGQLPEARQQLAAARTIIARLVEQYPTWAQWRKDLVSYNMVGDVLVAQGNLFPVSTLGDIIAAVIGAVILLLLIGFVRRAT
jgi:hypothetical protein